MFGRLFRLWSVVRNDVRLLWFALRHPDKPDQPLGSDLDWKALENFLASCQNLPERSDNLNLSHAAADRGRALAKMAQAG